MPRLFEIRNIERKTKVSFHLPTMRLEWVPFPNTVTQRNSDRCNQIMSIGKLQKIDVSRLVLTDALT